MECQFGLAPMGFVDLVESEPVCFLRSFVPFVVSCLTYLVTLAPSWCKSRFCEFQLLTAAGCRFGVPAMARLTRGMTSVAINSIERFARPGSTQSIPA